MKKPFAILLLLLIGCSGIRIEPSGHKGMEVIFCEIDEDVYPFTSHFKLTKDMQLEIDYKEVSNRRGIVFGEARTYNMWGVSFSSYMYSTMVYNLDDGSQIFIESLNVPWRMDKKTGWDFVVEVEKYEKLERMIGDTIWLNRSSHTYSQKEKYGPTPQLLGIDGSYFHRFEEVIITSIITYYNGIGDGLWFGIKSKDGKEGSLMHFDPKGYRYISPLIDEKEISYFTENPVNEGWDKEIVESIAKREIGLGMTKEQVRLSWGKPRSISKSMNSLGVIEIWDYIGRYVTFHNNEVDEVSIIDEY